MTHPTRYLARIVLFLAVIFALAFGLHDVLFHAFMSNPGLNFVILAVMTLGILWNIHLTTRLFPEVKWISVLQQPREGLKVPAPPRLLAPMARLFRARREHYPHFALSHQTTSAMLESLTARMDEGREISRYITQLLVFLGLLGTFYGLILTVRSIADVIGAMPSGGADLTAMFEHVRSGLTQPLIGMSTAFSASMFGLAGSLILGFIDLTAGQAQNRFANEVEDWLAGITFIETPDAAAIAGGQPGLNIFQHTPGSTQAAPAQSEAQIIRELTSQIAQLREEIAAARADQQEG